MKVVAEIELYNILKTKFTEAEAEKIIANLDDKIEDKAKDTRAIFKDDIISLKEYMDKVFATKADMAKELGELKADIIKWMFIFWVGSIGVLSGIMFAMLHAYLK